MKNHSIYASPEAKRAAMIAMYDCSTPTPRGYISDASAETVRDFLVGIFEAPSAGEAFTYQIEVVNRFNQVTLQVTRRNETAAKFAFELHLAGMPMRRLALGDWEAAIEAGIETNWDECRYRTRGPVVDDVVEIEFDASDALNGPVSTVGICPLEA